MPLFTTNKIQEIPTNEKQDSSYGSANFIYSWMIGMQYSSTKCLSFDKKQNLQSVSSSY